MRAQHQASRVPDLWYTVIPLMAQTRGEKKRTNLLILLGSAILAFVPLYVTRFHGAIADGALLLIAATYAADGIFRAARPGNAGGNKAMAAVISCTAFLAFATAEYTPIAGRLLRQAIAIEDFVDHNSDAEMKRFQANTLEDRKHSDLNVPNDSVVFLICSLLLDAAAIIWVEE
jgi:hypothetical protein